MQKSPQWGVQQVRRNEGYETVLFRHLILRQFLRKNEWNRRCTESAVMRRTTSTPNLNFYSLFINLNFAGKFDEKGASWRIFASETYKRYVATSKEFETSLYRKFNAKFLFPFFFSKRQVYLKTFKILDSNFSSITKFT